MTITPYLMDNRLMVRRAKTIYEMKPDLLWDARHGCYNALDSICTNNQTCAKWVDRRQGVELTHGTDSERPYWYEWGMCDEPSLLFGNASRLAVASVAASILGATQHTVLMIGYTVDLARTPTAVAFYNTSDANKYLRFGIDTNGKMFTLAQETATAEGTRTAAATTAAPHTYIWTNASASAWKHVVDGVEMELEDAAAGGNTGRSISEVTDLDKLQVGYHSTTARWYGHISLIAIWGKTI